ncbi:MAG TPA: TatD family hydrolase [Gemmataceae bacterium]|nr:TatD family hydrolase [Gemmataceae bacterium]
MAALIDTHAHLDAEQFADDLPAVLDRARGAGVVQIVAVATTATDSAACISLASNHPYVFATAGVHPNNAAQAGPGDWDAVVVLAARKEVVGIGETGLDRHWNDTPFPLQEDYFGRHLELGRRLNKPVVIHCREADADVLRMLRVEFDKNGLIQGVMHSFVGDEATAEACRAMGLYLSFAGMLTYKNAQALREVAAKQPLDKVLVETDCPYLSPVPLRGKRNEPANVAHTAACLAGLHALSPEALAERTTRNARGLFGLPS